MYKDKSAKMAGYIANYCKEASDFVIRTYLKKFSENKIKTKTKTTQNKK